MRSIVGPFFTPTERHAKLVSSFKQTRLLRVCEVIANLVTIWVCNENHRAATYGPRQANLVLIAYASSEGSGEPAHPRSLARTSAARSYKL